MAIDPKSAFLPSIHAYCSTNALCASFAVDRAKQATVTLEFAQKRSSGSGYDWKEKVGFQLTQGDLAELTAFMFFPSTSLRLVHRSGAGTLKGLDVTRQGEKFVFELSISGQRFAVPIVPKDQYFLKNLLLSRLIEIQPDLPYEFHLESLRQLAEVVDRRRA